MRRFCRACGARKHTAFACHRGSAHQLAGYSDNAPGSHDNCIYLIVDGIAAAQGDGEQPPSLGDSSRLTT